MEVTQLSPVFHSVQMRRAAGFPAISIQWGLIGGVGHVAELDMSFENQDVQIARMARMPIDECLALLGDLCCMGTAAPLVVTTFVNKGEVEGEAEGGRDTRTLAEAVMDILGLQASKVGPKEALANLGIDSMQMVEVRTTVQRMAAIPISLPELGNLTLETLQELQKKVKSVAPPKPALQEGLSLPPPPALPTATPLSAASPALPSRQDADGLLNLGAGKVERAPAPVPDQVWHACSFNQE